MFKEIHNFKFKKGGRNYAQFIKLIFSKMCNNDLTPDH